MPFLNSGFLASSQKSGPSRSGKDGVTPHIGDNGNWFIGNKDTGVPAKADIGDAITHVGLNGTTLVFQHGDGAKHAIQLPKPQSAPSTPTGITDQIKSIEQQLASTGTDINNIKTSQGDLMHRVDSLSSVFSYRGTGSFSYPNTAKHAYFINLYNLNNNTFPLSLPNVLTTDGTSYLLNNGSSGTVVTIRPKTGESIGNGDHLDVQPRNFALLVKNGSDWIVASQGYIPTSYDDLKNRIAQSLGDELHTNTDITNLFNQLLANPTTQQKILDIVNKHSGGSHPQPSSIQVHIGTGSNYPNDFSREIGHYAPHVPLVVNGLDLNPAKVWIAVPSSSASKVTGIVANGGLAATWDSKEITVNREKWTVYLSPTLLADHHVSFTLNWSV